MKRAWPWILLAAFNAAWFAYWETEAFLHPERLWTLSYTISFIGAHWPFFIFLCGGLAVGLGVHFFWPWQANPLGKGGG